MYQFYYTVLTCGQRELKYLYLAKRKKIRYQIGMNFRPQRGNVLLQIKPSQLLPFLIAVALVPNSDFKKKMKKKK